MGRVTVTPDPFTLIAYDAADIAAIVEDVAALVGIGLANTVPVLFSTAGQMKDFPPSMGVAMVATLGYGGLLLGPPLIGFGGEIFGLRAMLGLLIGFAFVIIILSQRALRRSAVQFS